MGSYNYDEGYIQIKKCDNWQEANMFMKEHRTFYIKFTKKDEILITFLQKNEETNNDK